MKEIINAKKGVFIGDLCYVLSDNVYHNEWGDAHGYKDGHYKHDGKDYAMHGTGGDGCFFDTVNHISIGVDSGTIGICDLELVEKHDDRFGIIINEGGDYIFEVDENNDFTVTKDNKIVSHINTLED